MSSDDEETLFATKIDNTSEGGSDVDPTNLTRTIAPTVPDINIPEHLTLKVSEIVPNTDLNVPEIAILDFAETELVENRNQSDEDHGAVSDDQVPDNDSERHLSGYVIPNNDVKHCQNFEDGRFIGLTNYESSDVLHHESIVELHNACGETKRNKKLVCEVSAPENIEKKQGNSTMSSLCSNDTHLSEEMPKLSVDHSNSSKRPTTSCDARENLISERVHGNSLTETKQTKTQTLFTFPPVSAHVPTSNCNENIVRHARQAHGSNDEGKNNTPIIFHASQIQNVVSKVTSAEAVFDNENAMNPDPNQEPVIDRTMKEHCIEENGKSSPQVKRKHSASEMTQSSKMLIQNDSLEDNNVAVLTSARNSVPCVSIENTTSLPAIKTSTCALKTSNSSVKYAIPMYLIVNREDLDQNLNLADFSKGVTANVNMSVNKIVNNDADVMSSKLANSTLTKSLQCQIVPMLTNASDDGNLLASHTNASATCSKSIPKLVEPFSQTSPSCSTNVHGENIEISSSTEEKAKKAREKPCSSQIKDTTFKSKDISTVPETLTCEKSSSFDSESIPESSKNSDKKANAGKKLDSLKFPPCTVCGGEASGFHYGCNTCEACKNFFRRCLLRKKGVNFFCSQGQNCEISFKKNKNNCSSCRYKKCLDLGMSKDKCKMGRYTYSRRTETINQVRKLEGKDIHGSSDSTLSSACSSTSTSAGNSPLPSPGISGEPASQCTSNDPMGSYIAKHISAPAGSLPLESMTNKELIEHLIAASAEIMIYSRPPEEITKMCRECYLEYNRKVSLFGSLTNVSMEEYHKLLKGYGIDMGNIWEQFKMIALECDPLIARYCKFAKQIPEFSNLSFDDQSTLLKTTNPSFFMILMHEGYRSEYNVFLEINGQPFHVDEVADKFYSRSFIESNCKMMAYIQTLHLNPEEVALLGTIATMAGDQCVLQNRELVDRVQEHLTNVLQQELVKNYGQIQGTKRFTKFIDLLVTLRDFSINYQKEFKVMCDDPMVKKEFPNIDVMLPDDV